jgi:16S rRNA U516 pseudouridylate synthase RsuA-like enzyme
VFALADVTMREGKRREVRRLMKGIGFRTVMLARIAIGGLDQAVKAPFTVSDALDHVAHSEVLSPGAVRALVHVHDGQAAPMLPGGLRVLSDDEVTVIFGLQSPP